MSKEIVLTDAGGVLCEALVKALAKEGHKRVVLDLRKDAADTIANEINASGGMAIGVTANVLERQFLDLAKIEVNNKFGLCDILINALTPGFLLTDQNRSLLTESDGSLTARGNQVIEQTPMGKFGEPEDLVGTTIWLCGEGSSFVTGVIVPIDGGFSAYSSVY